ncbi:hypothetical protein L0337_45740 [candidate division KSB1 bacterium]|nr:hypothetical protein [candidate division KSB1 bacterium]
MKDRKMVFGIVPEVDQDGMEQTVDIFLSSIFLSSECFCGMLLLCRSKQAAEAKTEK